MAVSRAATAAAYPVEGDVELQLDVAVEVGVGLDDHRDGVSGGGTLFVPHRQLEPVLARYHVHQLTQSRGQTLDGTAESHW